MPSKEIKFGNDARTRIKNGIDMAAAAVGPTLGAVGMSAIVDWEGLDPIVSDDGVTILKNLEFKDKYENIGLKILRKAAVRTSLEGGDGTATTTVLAHAIITEAFKEITNDSSKIQEVKQRLERGLQGILEELSKIKRDVKEEDIEKIAAISSLDPEVAKLIAEVIKEIGINGIVTVEKSSTLGYSKEIVKGAKFDKGLISPYFINDPEKERCVLENPYIFLANRKISINEQVKPLLDAIHQSGNKSVLIIADDVEGLALASLIQNCSHVISANNMQGTFKIACVRNPYTASRAIDFLFDIAALTGATVINEEAGMRLDGAKIEHCGMAEKVIVTKDNCIIVGGKSSEALNERITAIQSKIAETTSDFDKATLEERLACLTGGVGVIRVGAYTDTEFNAKKYKFENAINSTQAALQEGILPGGGIALAQVAANIPDEIFIKSLVTPFFQQVKNAGIDDSNNLIPFSGDVGIDFKTKKVGNMFDAGIIDPFKVVRLALESAVSIASTLITVEAAIVNEVEDDKQ